MEANTLGDIYDISRKFGLNLGGESLVLVLNLPKHLCPSL